MGGRLPGLLPFRGVGRDPRAGFLTVSGAVAAARCTDRFTPPRSRRRLCGAFGVRPRALCRGRWRRDVSAVLGVMALARCACGEHGHLRRSAPRSWYAYDPSRVVPHPNGLLLWPPPSTPSPRSGPPPPGRPAGVRAVPDRVGSKAGRPLHAWLPRAHPEARPVRRYVGGEWYLASTARPDRFALFGANEWWWLLYALAALAVYGIRRRLTPTEAATCVLAPKHAWRWSDRRGGLPAPQPRPAALR